MKISHWHGRDIYTYYFSINAQYETKETLKKLSISLNNWPCCFHLGETFTKYVFIKEFSVLAFTTQAWNNMADSVSLMTKKLLTGNKCRSDSFFCHDGGRIRQWWKRWNGRKEKSNINVWKIKMKLRPELVTQMKGSKNVYLGIHAMFLE